MSVRVMDMGNYEVRQNEPETDEYLDQALCAGWVETMAIQQSSSFENQPSIPESLVNTDVGRFLQKMYILQR